jgi:replicative superfamily II helicase
LEASICAVFSQIRNCSSPGAELTGDTEGDERLLLRHCEIIVTTPEKWDAVTRKAGSQVYGKIRLLLVASERTDNSNSRSMKFIS